MEINEGIRDREVRVIDAAGSQLGIMSTRAAPAGMAAGAVSQPLTCLLYTSELHVHDVGELLQHQLVDHAAQRGGRQLFLVPLPLWICKDYFPS